MEFGPDETTYEVLAVRYGTRETTKSECYYRYASYGEPDAPLAMDYFFWILRNAEETILVDTGFGPEAGERRGRTCLCPPLEALERLDVDPAAVSKVVLTHLHYDHTGNVDAFPQAQLVVPEVELDFWTGPMAERAQFAAIIEPNEIGLIAASQRVRRLHGSERICPGIEAIHVGGHSPGQLILVVNGERGPVVLASDAIHYYEELELDRPFEVVVDLAEMYRGYDTLRELAESPGTAIVAGHDPEVMERFPAISDGLAVRAG